VLAKCGNAPSLPIHRMTARFFVILSALTFALASAMGAPSFRETPLNKRTYVTFESFCEFFQFSVPTIPRPQPGQEPETFEFQGRFGSIGLTPNSRKALFNGRRVWLSYDFVVPDDPASPALISKLDAVKLFIPLLFRNYLRERPPAKGVIVDPGHGGSDRGARSRSTGYTEKKAALETAKALDVFLKKNNVPTKMTRTRDVDLTLEERAELAQKYPDWILVSIHYNAGPSHSHGVETYCLTPQYAPSTSSGDRVHHSDDMRFLGNSYDPWSLILSDYVHGEITKLHAKEGDRGLKRARFVVLREVSMPAILVECAFMSHKVDAQLISRNDFRQKIAEAIGGGILQYMAYIVRPLGIGEQTLKASSPQASKPTSSQTASEVLSTPPAHPRQTPQPLASQPELRPTDSSADPDRPDGTAAPTDKQQPQPSDFAPGQP
jgi:N-acetylmuramoyl-L-alanine amidase